MQLVNTEQYKPSFLADLMLKKIQSGHYLPPSARHVHMTGSLNIMRSWAWWNRLFRLTRRSGCHTLHFSLCSHLACSFSRCVSVTHSVPFSHSYTYFLCLGESSIPGVETGALKSEQSFTSCNHFSNQASIMFSAVFSPERRLFSCTALV